MAVQASRKVVTDTKTKNGVGVAQFVVMYLDDGTKQFVLELQAEGFIDANQLLTKLTEAIAETGPVGP